MDSSGCEEGADVLRVRGGLFDVLQVGGTHSPTKGDRILQW